MADMWVQAAINVDNEEVFETDTESQDEDSSTPTARSPLAASNITNRYPGKRSNRPSTSADTNPPMSFSTPGRRPSLPLHGGGRRPSASSYIPAIFSHTGVKTPPALLSRPGSPGPMDPAIEALSPILESRPVSMAVEPLSLIEEKPSIWSQLPILVIIQYGLLAFHTTTHDQIFYLYLVS